MSKVVFYADTIPSLSRQTHTEARQTWRFCNEYEFMFAISVCFVMDFKLDLHSNAVKGKNKEMIQLYGNKC